MKNNILFLCLSLFCLSTYSDISAKGAITKEDKELIKVYEEVSKVFDEINNPVHISLQIASIVFALASLKHEAALFGCAACLFVDCALSAREAEKKIELIVELCKEA